MLEIRPIFTAAIILQRKKETELLFSELLNIKSLISHKYQHDVHAMVVSEGCAETYRNYMAPPIVLYKPQMPIFSKIM